jgi:hypothetical protein
MAIYRHRPYKWYLLARRRRHNARSQRMRGEVALEFPSSWPQPGECREGVRDERGTQPREVHPRVLAGGGPEGQGRACGRCGGQDTGDAQGQPDALGTGTSGPAARVQPMKNLSAAWRGRRWLRPMDAVLRVAVIQSGPIAVPDDRLVAVSVSSPAPE